MLETYEPIARQPNTPLGIIRAELDRVLIDRLPSTINPVDIRRMTGLDSDEPDGKTLIERLMPDLGKPKEGKQRVIQDFDDLMNVQRKLDWLLRLNETGHFDDNQNDFTHTMAEIAIRQIRREGNICPAASSYVRRLNAVRPELFPEDVITKLNEKQGHGDQPRMILRLNLTRDPLASPFSDPQPTMSLDGGEKLSDEDREALQHLAATFLRMALDELGTAFKQIGAQADQQTGGMILPDFDWPDLSSGPLPLKPRVFFPEGKFRFDRPLPPNGTIYNNIRPKFLTDGTSIEAILKRFWEKKNEDQNPDEDTPTPSDDGPPLNLVS